MQNIIAQYVSPGQYLLILITLFFSINTNAATNQLPTHWLEQSLKPILWVRARSGKYRKYH